MSSIFKPGDIVKWEQPGRGYFLAKVAAVHPLFELVEPGRRVWVASVVDAGTNTDRLPVGREVAVVEGHARVHQSPIKAKADHDPAVLVTELKRRNQQLGKAGETIGALRDTNARVREKLMKYAAETKQALSLAERARVELADFKRGLTTVLRDRGVNVFIHPATPAGVASYLRYLDAAHKSDLAKAKLRVIPRYKVEDALNLHAGKGEATVNELIALIQGCHDDKVRG